MKSKNPDLYRISIRQSDEHPDFVHIAMHVDAPGTAAAREAFMVSLSGHEAVGCVRGLLLGGAAAALREHDPELADRITAHLEAASETETH